MIDDFYQPTPSEIRAACARIRAGWSADDHIARREKCPPMLKADYVGLQAEAEIKLEETLVRRRDALAGAV